jgi:hypothetical protein
MLIPRYAKVSMAMSGDINGNNAVPTRPRAMIAMIPSVRSNTTMFAHLLIIRKFKTIKSFVTKKLINKTKKFSKNRKLIQH